MTLPVVGLVADCAGNCESSGVNALQPANRFRQRPQFTADTAQNDHFQTPGVIDVNVHRRDHLPAVVVLKREQFFHQMRLVVIVDERKRGGHRFIGVEGFVRERLPNQMANRFAPGCE